MLAEEEPDLSGATELRARAIERLKARTEAPDDAGPDSELHALQVYQEELLMQQESLLEANNQLASALQSRQLLFDQAPLSYLVVDPSGAIRELNYAAASTLGAHRNALVGKLLGSRLTPASAIRFLACLRRVFTDRQDQHEEVRLRTGDAVLQAHFRLASGLVAQEEHCLVTCHDVTDLRRIESELDEARAVAERASHLKGRFLANMSHEVRTPLTLILGFVETLLARELEPDVHSRLEIILRAGRNLLNVLNDVVDFSKIEANRLTIDRKPFDARAAIDHACELFREAASARQIALALRVDERAPLPPRQIGDKMRLAQVLVNLLSNALKFTPDGGFIRVDAAYRSGNLIMTVRDSGPGIPKSQLEHIFEPFKQVDDSDSRERGGAGLGLAISRQVLTLMGGDLLAHNAPGGGACFTLQLPMRSAGPVEEQPGRPPAVEVPRYIPSDPSIEPRILVAEDDADIRALIGWLIETTGHRYDFAKTGLEALEKLREREYGMVLMDLQMPELDGLAATRRIRADPSLRELWVVAVTARAMENERAEAQDAGLDFYLPKPVDLERLSALIESRLGPAPRAPEP